MSSKTKLLVSLLFVIGAFLFGTLNGHISREQKKSIESLHRTTSFLHSYSSIDWIQIGYPPQDDWSSLDAYIQCRVVVLGQSEKEIESNLYPIAYWTDVKRPAKNRTLRYVDPYANKSLSTLYLKFDEQGLLIEKRADTLGSLDSDGLTQIKCPDN